MLTSTSGMSVGIARPCGTDTCPSEERRAELSILQTAGDVTIDELREAFASRLTCARRMPSYCHLSRESSMLKQHCVS
jgi:hypothetical protein